MFYAIGDIHGYAEVLLSLLYKSVLIDHNGHWMGGDATLVFLGDFVDRGPDSIDTVGHVRRLQAEAAAAGGRVLAVMGNHDLALLLAIRHAQASLGDDETFRSFWEWIGGDPADTAMPAEHLDWIAQLPVMLRVEDTLIIHADTLFYASYGATIEQVNLTVTRMIRDGHLEALAQLMRSFSQHRDFWMVPDSVEGFLKQFGARRLLHGHTPIHKMAGRAVESVRAPLVYADGRCINLDGGIYFGGRGFVYRSDED
jgi:hypothetical protein